MLALSGGEGIKLPKVICGNIEKAMGSGASSAIALVRASTPYGN